MRLDDPSKGKVTGVTLPSVAEGTIALCRPLSALRDSLLSVASNLSSFERDTLPSNAAQCCTNLISLLPEKHPASRAFKDFLESTAENIPNSAAIYYQLEAGCRILTYDLFKDLAAFEKPIETLRDTILNGTIRSPLLTEWRSGTEVTVYREGTINLSNQNIHASNERELLIKIPHPQHAALAAARAFKKQTFGTIISERVSPSIVEIEPLIAHNYFWRQYYVPGPTFTEIIDSSSGELKAAALNRWDQISRALNGDVWFACWHSFPQILGIFQDVPVDPSALGKRFPDFDGNNLILVGKGGELTVEDVEKARAAIIDW